MLSWAIWRGVWGTIRGFSSRGKDSPINYKGRQLKLQASPDSGILCVFTCWLSPLFPYFRYYKDRYWLVSQAILQLFLRMGACQTWSLGRFEHHNSGFILTFLKFSNFLSHFVSWFQSVGRIPGCSTKCKQRSSARGSFLLVRNMVTGWV